MLKKEILNNLNWHPIYDSLLDYFLWTQLAPNYEFYYLNKKLTNWRMSKKSYINSLSQQDFKKDFLWRLDICRNLYGKIDSPKSIDFINKNVYKNIKKYKKYKKLFTIFLTTSCVELLVILLLLHMIIGRLSI